MIHEFKSILEKNENDFILDHKEQILFYAGILFENNSDYKITGLLYSAELFPHIINFSQTSAKDFTGSMREQILEVVQNKKDYELLQKPSPENCLYCKLKPVCKSFINSQASFGNYEGLTLTGSVISKSSISRLFGQIDLKTESGDRKILIPLIHPFYRKCEIGLSFAFSDLSISKNKIEFTPRTVIYDLNK